MYGDGEELDYRATTRSSGVKDSVNVNDEKDLPILKRLVEYHTERIAELKTIDAIDERDKVFSASQQIAINRKVVEVLQAELDGMVDVIEDIKDKYERD